MITGLKLFDDLMLVSVGLVWLGLVRWTYTDARRRIADPKLVRFATLSAFVPVVGLVVYVIVRPPDYLDDVHQYQLEMHALEVRLRQLGSRSCPHCDYELRQGFVRCPRCAKQLKQPCPSCRQPLDVAWKVCPFCEADLSAPAPVAATNLRSIHTESHGPRRRSWPPVQAVSIHSVPRPRSVAHERLDAGR